MRTMTKGFATLAALVALAACSDAPTAVSMEPGFARDVYPMVFTHDQDVESPLQQWGGGGPGVAQFGGSIETPTPCYDITATSTVSGGRIVVTVSATRSGDWGCIQVIANHAYTGQISTLPSGAYTMRIMHEVNGTRTTAYSGSVTVQ